MNLERRTLVGCGLLIWCFTEVVFAASSPEVRFTSITDGQYVAGIVRLSVEVVHNSPISQVSITKGGEVLGVDFEPPFELDWDTRKEADGPFTLQATALDQDFRQGVVRLTVTVDNTRPSVTLTEPSDGTIAAGTIPLAVEVSDVIGIRSVRFLANGASVGEATEAPYDFQWDTNTVPNTRYAIQAEAFDRAGNSVNSKEAMVRVANFNRRPMLEPIGPQTVSENTVLRFTVKGTDPDAPRDPVSYRAFNLPPWATVNPTTGEFVGKPPVTEASLRHPTKEYAAVRFEACDPQPLCDGEEVVITVVDNNSPPVIQPLGNYEIKEGETLAFKVESSDPDGDETTCRARRLPKWATFHTATCTFRGTPGPAVASLEQRVTEFKEVMFEVCDKQPLCASQLSTITVLDVNSSPFWETVPDQEGGEDQRLWVDVKAVDPDGDRLKIRAEVLPDRATFLDAGDGTGRLTWRPRSDQSGRYEVSLSVTDSDLSALLTIAIRVTERVLAISGIVADKQKEPYAGVLIRLFLKGFPVQEVTTNEKGFYLLTNVKPVAYVVKPFYEIERTFQTRGAKLHDVSFAPVSQRVELEATDSRGLDFLIEFE